MRQKNSNFDDKLHLNFFSGLPLYTCPLNFKMNFPNQNGTKCEQIFTLVIIKDLCISIECIWAYLKYRLPHVLTIISYKMQKTRVNSKRQYCIYVESSGLNSTNIFTRSFYARSSQKHKSSVSFYAFGTYRRKSCS